MAKNIFSTNYTLGILGGGQLGKMMLYTTRKFDIRTKVLGSPLQMLPAQFGAQRIPGRFSTRLRYRHGVCRRL
jgi:phosphoribosylaminoimidazole carboxylase (NCAIR synthetase)